MKKDILSLLKMAGLYIALSVGTLLMLKIIVQYTDFGDRTGFLEFKQEYLHLPVWKIAFYIHVFSSIFTLAAGMTQFSTEILKNFPKLHRLVGRIYVWDILFINVPTGLILAVYANGGLPTKIAFVLLDTLWFWFTLKAIVEIKIGNLTGHREYMLRSYALTFSAVTLRTWQLVLSNSFNIDPQTLYMLDAWLGFVPNLICVEWLIAQKRNDLAMKSTAMFDRHKSQNKDPD